MNAVMTDHAFDRAKERCGWNRNAAQRMANKALADGVILTDTAGSLKRYIDKQHISHPGHRSVIYGNSIFIFADENVVVTILDLPLKYRRSAKDAKSKRQK